MSLAEQVKAIREGGAWIDRSGRGKLRVTGADRLSFLHNMLSAAITDLKPGEGCRAELLDERAHVVADLRLYLTEDPQGPAVLVDTEPGLAPVVKERLEKYVIMDDVTIEDVTATLALFTVCGPKVAGTLGLTLPEKRYASRRTSLAGVEVLVVAAHWTGSTDYDLYVAQQDRDRVRGALALTSISPEAFDLASLEAGIARQGAELDGVVALEARLEEEGALSLTKCYLGQEVIARIVGRGHVNRLLVGLTLEGDPPPAGTPVSAEGKEAGQVIRSARSPTLGKTIATAYLRREQSEPGTRVEVAGQRATVAKLPFVS